MTHCTIGRLYDEGLMFPFLLEFQTVILEGGVIPWQDPCFWNEVVTVWVGFDHSTMKAQKGKKKMGKKNV